MRLGDPRFDSCPSRPGAGQLRGHIQRTAEGALSLHELPADFRAVHAAAEHRAPPEYDSSEEARAIWDVLWAVAFCSVNAAQEANPEDWHIPDAVLGVVKRAARQLDGTAP